MSASTLLPLLDLVDLVDQPLPDSGGGNLPPDGAPQRRTLAERLIQWSIDEYKRLRNLDDLPPHPRDPARRQMFVLMHKAYDEWATDAEAILERVAPMRGDGPIAGWTELEDAVGRTRARLSVTLDDLDKAEEQIRNGQVISLEEVKHELRRLRAGSER